MWFADVDSHLRLLLYIAACRDGTPGASPSASQESISMRSSVTAEAAQVLLGPCRHMLKNSHFVPFMLSGSLFVSLAPLE